MKVVNGWKGCLGFVASIILVSGLTACSKQTAPSDGLQLEASQARNITVYESPT
ncbi:MAG: hypothetical protein V3T55_01920 [Anaerolineales bacterium]